MESLGPLLLAPFISAGATSWRRATCAAGTLILHLPQHVMHTDVFLYTMLQRGCMPQLGTSSIGQRRCRKRHVHPTCVRETLQGQEQEYLAYTILEVIFARWAEPSDSGTHQARNPRSRKRKLRALYQTLLLEKNVL